MQAHIGIRAERSALLFCFGYCGKTPVGFFCAAPFIVALFFAAVAGAFFVGTSTAARHNDFICCGDVHTGCFIPGVGAELAIHICFF